MAQHPWSGPFLADLVDCLSSEGPIPVLEVMLAELNHPSLDFDRTKGDPLAYFAPLLCALSLNGNRPMVEDLISVYLPGIFDISGKRPESTEIYGLCGLIKHTLSLTAHLLPEVADHLAEILVSDIDDRSNRPVADEPSLAKKRKLANSSRGSITSTQKAMLDMMKNVLAADEELGVRWSRMKRLRGR